MTPRLGAGIVTLALTLVTLGGVQGASTTLDFVTFDGIDYIRWLEEPGRALTREDLGSEFATVECSLGEDVRGCPYGRDAGAAFLPAGTRMYAVRGYATSFRLAAVWRDRVFLYQVWRNPRARHGGDLYDIVGKVRAIDVRRGEATAGAGCETSITATRDLEALVAMMAGGAVRPPQAHPVAELRYWITVWLADGTTLGRPYFAETRELMGGLALPPEFNDALDRCPGGRR